MQIKDNGRQIKGWQLIKRQHPERRRDEKMMGLPPIIAANSKLSPLINKGEPKVGQ